MYMAFQVMMGALGLFVVWTLIKAAQSGLISSKQVEFSLNESPFAFSMAFAVHTVIAIFCFWVAFGYEPGEFFDMLGLPHGWQEAVTGRAV